MNDTFSIYHFHRLFPSEESCYEAIITLQYPYGIYCLHCKKATRHYKLKNRAAYSCKYCRRQIFPLKGTLFEKTSTPIRTWFYALWIMTQSKGELSAKQLQNELQVTYKTAWRIRSLLYSLMKQNNGDLLKKVTPYLGGQEQNVIKRWTFFNKFEFRMVEKQESQHKK